MTTQFKKDEDGRWYNVEEGQDTYTVITFGKMGRCYDSYNGLSPEQAKYTIEEAENLGFVTKVLRIPALVTDPRMHHRIEEASYPESVQDLYDNFSDLLYTFWK